MSALELNINYTDILIKGAIYTISVFTTVYLTGSLRTFKCMLSVK